MTLKYKNNAQTTLSAGINDSVTSIAVVDGSVFPALTGIEYFYMTLEDVSLNREVVKVTARSGNTLTVVRAQDGSVARAFSIGDKAEGRLVAAMLADLSAPSYILAALLTVDGTGSTLDADLLDGQSSAYYLAAGSYTAADVLSKLLTVDGAGSGLDADLLDGQSSAYYLAAGSYTAADVLSKLLTVDGAGSGLDADLLDGYNIGTSGGTIPLLSGTNTWSNAQIAPSFTVSNTSSGAPQMIHYVSDAGADNKRWWNYANSGQMYWQLVNDAFNATTTWMNVTRSGMTVSSIALSSNAFTWNGVAIPTISSTDTLSNKTLSSPTLSGTVAGSPTFSGVPSFARGTGHEVMALNQTTPASYNLDVQWQDNGSVRWLTSVRTASTDDFWLYNSARGNADLAISASTGVVAFSNGATGQSGVAIPTISSTDTLSNKTLAATVANASILWNGSPTNSRMLGMPWAEMSSDAGGYGVFGNNLYANWDGSAVSYRTAQTHGGVGYGAIRFGYGITNIAAFGGATTAGATVTPTWHTLWHSGNDGSGSGLDADLLDGYSSTAFFEGMPNNTDHYQNARVIRNANSSVSNDGMYIGFGNTNSGFTRLYGGGSTGLHWYITGGQLHTNGGSTEDHYIRIGSNRSGSGYAYLDLQGDTTYGSGLRLIRTNGGVNANSNIEHSGTGSLQLITQHAGYLTFSTSATQRAYFSPTTSTLIDSPSGLAYWHGGNDGAGSGLDADLLDGLNAVEAGTPSTIPRRSANGQINAGGTGLAGSSAAFIAAGSYGGGFAMNDGGYAGMYTDTAGANLRLYSASGSTITFNGNAVWHAGNDGAGSGLDADLLDGYNIGTSGGTVPLLNGTNTWSALQTFSVGAPTTEAVRISNTAGGQRLHLRPASVSSENSTLYLNSADGYDIQLQSLGTTYWTFDENSTASWFRINNRTDGTAGGAYLDFRTAAGTQYMIFGNRSVIVGGAYDSTPTMYSATHGSLYWFNGNAQFWHAGNDGSGSGLDADLWDGNNFASYLNQSVLTSSTPTFAGTINTSVLYVSFTNPYMCFYPAGLATRLGYFQMTDAGAVNLVNETSGGHIHLNTTGAGVLYKNGSTVWHAGNDGSGSTLDADTVDNVHASQIVYGGSTGKSLGDQSNMNSNTLRSGFYYYNNPSNGPIADWQNWIQVRGDGWGDGNQYGFQISSAFHSNNLYYRRHANASYDSWFNMWHSGSDGSGSGLDADLLDGYNADINANASTVAVRSSAGDLNVSSIYASNWFRSTGGSGWYNQTFGGGIFMQDTTYVKVYGGKAFYVPNSIDATGNITAYYSDERLKTKTRNVENALDQVSSLTPFFYVENETARSLGYNNLKEQVGLSAQEVQRILPQVVHRAPVDIAVDENGNKYSKSGEDYLTVDYARVVPLLVAAIKELRAEVTELKRTA